MATPRSTLATPKWSMIAAIGSAKFHQAHGIRSKCRHRTDRLDEPRLEIGALCARFRKARCIADDGLAAALSERPYRRYRRFATDRDKSEVGRLREGVDRGRAGIALDLVVFRVQYPGGAREALLTVVAKGRLQIRSAHEDNRVWTEESGQILVLRHRVFRLRLSVFD